MDSREGAGSHWTELSYHSPLVRSYDPGERPTLLTVELRSGNRLGPVPGNRLHFWCETCTIYAPRLEGLPSKDSCAPCHSMPHARGGLGSALVQRNFPLRVEMVFYGSLSRAHRSSSQIPVWQGRPVLLVCPVWSTVMASFPSSHSCGARVNRSPLMG